LLILNPFPFPSDSSSHQNPHIAAEYAVWLQDLKPRTCLLVHWLASMGAIYEPNAPTHYKARKFASKRVLLGKLVESSDELLSNKTNWLIENREFDLYVAYLMWLRSTNTCLVVLFYPKDVLKYLHGFASNFAALS
jgi:hypothetical protein